MDTLFFWLSKVAWLFLSPDSLLVLMLLGSWLLLRRGHERGGRWLLGTTVTLCLLIALLPFGEWLISPLEKRFPPEPALPERLDGILVLGGSIEPVGSSYWQQAQLNESGERLMALASLARRYPGAQLVFSGGSGNPLSQNLRESDFISTWVSEQGLDPDRLVIENRSRNTWENIVLTQELVQPQAGEHWLLITSAFHMPRAMGSAQHLGWNMTPWPVDYRSSSDPQLQVKFQFARHLDMLRVASREWLGLLVYRLTGRG